MGSIIPNVPVTQYLVSSPSTDLYKTPHGYKAACAFEAMPFLAFWFVPCLSYSVPWCFFGSWHSPLVQFRWVIPRWESPNAALCLIHPWLPVLSHSLWKRRCWSYPTVWQFWGVVAALSLLAASQALSHTFLKVQSQCFYPFILPKFTPTGSCF